MRRQRRGAVVEYGEEQRSRGIPRRGALAESCFSEQKMHFDFLGLWVAHAFDPLPEKASEDAAAAMVTI